MIFDFCQCHVGCRRSNKKFISKSGWVQCLSGPSSWKSGWVQTQKNTWDLRPWLSDFTWTRRPSVVLPLHFVVFECSEVFAQHTAVLNLSVTHPFNGPFSGTTRVSRYQKGKTNLDFTEASDSGFSWAICKSAPRSRQITTPAPHHSVFLQAGCPSCRPTNSVKALKALNLSVTRTIITCTVRSSLGERQVANVAWICTEVPWILSLAR